MGTRSSQPLAELLMEWSAAFGLEGTWARRRPLNLRTMGLFLQVRDEETTPETGCSDLQAAPNRVGAARFHNRISYSQPPLAALSGRA